MICKNLLLMIFVNESKVILFHTVKFFQVLLYITNNSSKPQSFVSSQFNDQAVFYRSPEQPTSVDLGAMAIKG